MTSNLRNLPSVDRLLNQEAIQPLVDQHGHRVVVEAVRATLEDVRSRLVAGEDVSLADGLVGAVVERVTALTQPSLQPVINATGVIIHTNLGRALLSQRAQTAMTQAAAAYSNLEYDLDAGSRGSRYVHAADLLCWLTGAEAAVVVNNNAGAVVLALTALARGLQVIISRGQLVEIGGGFRIPDIMLQSGCGLVEVGTTNRTYVGDFEAAIDPDQTGMLLTVHASNYRISGFTAQPDAAELAVLAQRYGIPLMEDLGSGTLLDTEPFGLAHEPTVQESLNAGVDLVTASGDKLLGGPQAGLILGRRALVEKIKKHPLTRALRVDKTTLAALQATLLAYLEGTAVDEIPVWGMIAATPKSMTGRARKWIAALKNSATLAEVSMQVVDSVSTVGGGSLPGQTLPTKALAIEIEAADLLAEKLRRPEQPWPPVIARIENDRLLLDPRTVLPEQDKTLITVLKQALLNTISS